MTAAPAQHPQNTTANLPFGRRSGLYVFVFASFLGSFLLFSIQPLFARRALPLLGGTAVVWNTAMVFFQAGLLAGYSLVHFLALRLDLTKQRIFLAVLYVAAAIVLPIGVAAGWERPPAGAGPVWLIAFFTVSIGLPYLAVATTAPVLQWWYRNSGAGDAHDPYWLYAASNIGSLVALLSYPVLVEPLLKLFFQEQIWSVMFVGLAAVMLLLGAKTTRAVRNNSPVTDAAPQTQANETAAKPVLKRKLYWIALTFVPCSLLLSVTTWMTEDLAAIPLLWVVPLAVYQLSYVLAFAKKAVLKTRTITGAVVPMLFLAVFVFYNAFPFKYSFGAFLLVLLVICWACHQTLADTRPAAKYLTTFYICLAFGGMMGGFFNTFVAPVIFNDLYELHTALLAAVLLVPCDAGLKRQLRRFWRKVRWPRFWMAYAGLAVVGYFALPDVNLWGWIMLGTGALLYFVMAFRARHLPAVGFVFFGLWFVALHVLQAGWGFTDMTFLTKVRSHYGRYSVVRAENGDITALRHGSTLHGIQVNLPEHENEPNSYYDEDGPVGQVFTVLHELGNDTPETGVLGLGIGNLLCYATDNGKNWTFYEIDPLIETLARNSTYFRAISGCGPQVTVKTGDGRLLLESEPDKKFDLLFIDAFNSDSVPVHLITKEAVDVYLQKIADDGLVMMNLSNNYAGVHRIVAGYANNHSDVHVRIKNYETLMDRQNNYGTPSTWGVLTKNPEIIRLLDAGFHHWQLPQTIENPVVWTDDHVNLFEIVNW